MKSLIFFVGILIVLSTSNQCQRLNFLPMPKQIKCNETSNEPHVLEDPCKILYHVVNPNSD